MGFIHPGERRAIHIRHRDQKIAEINLWRQADLIIMDGRKAFVSGGPDKRQLAEPGILLASGNMVAIDIEAMKMLLAYNARNKLTADPRQMVQVVTSLRHGLGADDYRLISG